MISGGLEETDSLKFANFGDDLLSYVIVYIPYAPYDRPLSRLSHEIFQLLTLNDIC